MKELRDTDLIIIGLLALNLLMLTIGIEELSRLVRLRPTRVLHVHHEPPRDDDERGEALRSFSEGGRAAE